MSTGKKIPLAEAESLANYLVGAIKPACERVQVVGSIRRQCPEVGDIELLVIPRAEIVPAGLWEGDVQETDLLNRQLGELVSGKAIRSLKGFKAGWKYSQWSLEGFPVDLFRASPETWGCLCLIRTGPADFSHRLVTPRQQGGLCPAHLKFKDGRLVVRETEEAITTPTEESVFEAIGLKFLPPEKRS